MGKVKGTITATEAINIRETASVEGELAAPKISISEGAFFRGQVAMERPKGEAVPAKDTTVTYGPIGPKALPPRSLDANVGAAATLHTGRSEQRLGTPPQRH